MVGLDRDGFDKRSGNSLVRCAFAEPVGRCRWRSLGAVERRLRLNKIRYAYLGAVASLTALIALCLAWELWLAPLRAGGSWMALKALPLLAPLTGILHGRIHTFQWAAMLVLAYFIEGVMRGYTDGAPSAMLAHLEVALALAFIGCAIWFVRSARAA